MGSKFSNRKVWLINRPFQISFLKHVLGLSIAVLAVVYSALWYFFYSFRKKGSEIGLNAEHVFFRFIDQQQFTMDVIFLALTILTVALILGYGLFLSNRVAGPLHRLKNHLSQYQSQEPYQDLAFRENDYFKDVAEAVNQPVIHR